MAQRGEKGLPIVFILVLDLAVFHRNVLQKRVLSCGVDHVEEIDPVDAIVVEDDLADAGGAPIHVLPEQVSADLVHHR